MQRKRLQNVVEGRRILREKRTIDVMLRIYCRARHGGRESLCSKCQALLAYAEERIEKCPYLPDKPSCAKCPVHCYAPASREEIRQVMRYAGPRMLFRHPLLTLLHSLDEARIKPAALPRQRRPLHPTQTEKRPKTNSAGSGMA